MQTVLLYILGILIMVVGLAVSIGLHELGHMLPAKRFGVRVSQYMIGFGPTLWSRRRGETEYGLKAIPLGGYISMAGMFPPKKAGGAARTATTGFFDTLVQEGERVDRRASMIEEAREASLATIEPGQEHRTFYALATWKRIVIMFGGPFANLLIAVVLYAVLLMGFGMPQASTTIGSVSECVLPAGSTATECSADDPAAPGSEAGLRPGDRFVSIDGTPVDSWAQGTAIIRDSAGSPLSIVVERDGRQVPITATPLLTERYVVGDDGKVVERDGQPVTEQVGFLGIGSATETVQQPVTAVLPAVGDNIGRVANMILNLPQRLIDIVQAAFGPAERDPNGPISVVGVGRLAGEITSLDTLPVADRAASLVRLLASLNVALFLFNLIPLLPLDGGHIAGAVVESVRRFFAKLFRRPDPGPVDTAKLIPVTFAILILLGAMSALLIYADLVKPISIL